MFTDNELKVTSDYIEKKKQDVLARKEGSDADYIRDLQTLIVLENAVEGRLENGS